MNLLNSKRTKFAFPIPRVRVIFKWQVSGWPQAAKERNIIERLINFENSSIENEGGSRSHQEHSECVSEK